jgi:hypothetical protein
VKCFWRPEKPLFEYQQREGRTHEDVSPTLSEPVDLRGGKNKASRLLEASSV